MASVYFIQAIVGGPIKIGLTGDVQGRLSSLQTGCPFELRVLATMPGDRAAEHGLHRRFADLHVGLEWFRPEGALIIVEARRTTGTDRKPLGPAFNEGARLLWIAIVARGLSQGALSRLLGMKSNGVANRWLWGHQRPAYTMRVLLKALFCISLDAWDEPPLEAFAPPENYSLGSRFAA